MSKEGSGETEYMCSLVLAFADCIMPIEPNSHMLADFILKTSSIEYQQHSSVVR